MALGKGVYGQLVFRAQNLTFLGEPLGVEAEGRLDLVLVIVVANHTPFLLTFTLVES